MNSSSTSTNLCIPRHIVRVYTHANERIYVYNTGLDSIIYAWRSFFDRTPCNPFGRFVLFVSISIISFFLSTVTQLKLYLRRALSWRRETVVVCARLYRPLMWCDNYATTWVRELKRAILILKTCSVVRGEAWGRGFRLSELSKITQYDLSKFSGVDVDYEKRERLKKNHP